MPQRTTKLSASRQVQCHESHATTKLSASKTCPAETSRAEVVDRSGSSLNFDARHISFLFRGSRCREGGAGSGGCLRLRRVCCGSCWRCLLCCLCRVGVGVCLLPACARVAWTCASVCFWPAAACLAPACSRPVLRISRVFPCFRLFSLGSGFFEL